MFDGAVAAQGAIRLALVGVVLACGLSLGGAQPAGDPAPGSTVLAGSFAEKLSLPRIEWPSTKEQDAVRDTPTEAARVRAMGWLIDLLRPEHRPFPTPAVRPPGGFQRAEVDYCKRFTAAISQDGQDLLCARWATSAYHFQFVGALDVMRLSVEPVRPGLRAPLTAKQAAARVRDFLASVLNDSARLLNYCDIEAEATPYGHRASVHCRDYAAWREQFGRNDTPLYHEWALYLVAHTDGTSFVLDIEPMRAANVVGADGRSPERWFSSTRGTTYRSSPTTAPAPDAREVEAKLGLLEELARQRREEQAQQ
jgi:hypothetical protein